MGLPLLITSRFLLGFGAGTLSVVRAYIAEVSTSEERTSFVAISSAVQFLGFAITPSLGQALSAIPTFHLGHFVTVDSLTIPGWFLFISNLLLLILILVVFRNPAPKSVDLFETVDPNAKSTWAIIYADKTVFKGFIVFMLINFLIRGTLGIFETLGTPIYITMKSRDTSGYFFGGMGLIGVIVLFAINWLSKHGLHDYIILMVGNLIMVAGCSVVMTQHMIFPRFVTGLVLIWGMGFPLAQTVVVSMFSKILSSSIGKSSQGTFMGLIGAAGAAGRIIGPLCSGALYTHEGTFWVFFYATGLSIVSVIASLFVTPKSLNGLSAPLTLMREMPLQAFRLVVPILERSSSSSSSLISLSIDYETSKSKHHLLDLSVRLPQSCIRQQIDHPKDIKVTYITKTRTDNQTMVSSALVSIAGGGSQVDQFGCKSTNSYSCTLTQLSGDGGATHRLSLIPTAPLNSLASPWVEIYNINDTDNHAVKILFNTTIIKTPRKSIVRDVKFQPSRVEGDYIIMNALVSIDTFSSNVFAIGGIGGRAISTFTQLTGNHSSGIGLLTMRVDKAEKTIDIYLSNDKCMAAYKEVNNTCTLDIRFVYPSAIVVPLHQCWQDNDGECDRMNTPYGIKRSKNTTTFTESILHPKHLGRLDVDHVSEDGHVLNHVILPHYSRAVGDDQPPTIRSITFIPLDSYEFIINIHIIDHTGLYKATYDTTVITPSNLVSGTPQDGHYEVIYSNNNLHNLANNTGFITLTNFAGNTYYYDSVYDIKFNKLPSYPIPLNSMDLEITYFRFDIPDIGDRNLVTLYINVTNINKDVQPKIMLSYGVIPIGIVKTRVNPHTDDFFTGRYDHTLKMYVISIRIRPQLANGVIPYHLWLWPRVFTAESISTFPLIGHSAYLYSYSKLTDEMGPMITYLNSTVGRVVESHDDGDIQIEWAFEITDLESGFQGGQAFISSNLDLELVPIRTFSSLDRVEGDEYTGHYLVSTTVAKDTCVSQIYSLDLVLYDFAGNVAVSVQVHGRYQEILPLSPFTNVVQESRHIELLCRNEMPIDNEPPIITEFRLSQHVDVGQPYRTVGVNLEVQDRGNGVLMSRLPYIYLSTVDKQVHRFQLELVSEPDNRSVAQYTGYTSLPFGFGVSASGYIIVEVAGLYDRSYNIASYSSIRGHSLSGPGYKYLVTSVRDHKSSHVKPLEWSSTLLIFEPTDFKGLPPYILQVKTNISESNEVYLAKSPTQVRQSRPTPMPHRSTCPSGCSGYPCHPLGYGYTIETTPSLHFGEPKVVYKKNFINRVDEESDELDHVESLQKGIESLDGLFSLLHIDELQKDGKVVRTMSEFNYTMVDHSTVFRNAYSYTAPINGDGRLNITVTWYTMATKIDMPRGQRTWHPKSVRYTIAVDHYKFAQTYNHLRVALESKLTTTHQRSCSSIFYLWDELGEKYGLDYANIIVNGNGLSSKFFKLGYSDGQLALISTKQPDDRMCWRFSFYAKTAFASLIMTIAIMTLYTPLKHRLTKFRNFRYYLNSRDKDIKEV
eukprot:gene6527-7558_t